MPAQRMSQSLSQRPTPLLAKMRQGYLRAIGALVAGMMAITVVVTCLQVIYRYVLNDALIWAEEICRYLLVWTSFLAAGLAFQRGELSSMDLLGGIMPRWLRLALLLPTYLAAVGFLGMLAWYGWDYAQTNSSQAMPAADFISQSLLGRDSGLSIWWVYISVPVGSVLLGLHFLLAALAMLAELLGWSPAEDR